VLGKGAFGTVVLGERTDSREGVAVKQLRKATVADALDLLHNEIAVWEALDHPHLVKLIDVFEEPENLILVTELMRGGDLFKKLEKANTFSEVVAARLARQIVSAVGYLHAHGVVHCDLKPSNILVSEREATDLEQLTVKIADFGLSQSLQVAQESSQLLTEVCGTPDYFAPELAMLAQGQGGADLASGSSGWDGKGYGPQIDCWAVGCIVYELLAGTPPYHAQDEAVLFYKIIENEMGFPPETFGSISPAAISLIKQLTSTDPTERLACEEALNHEWLQEGGKNAQPLPAEAKKNRRSSQVRRVSIRHGAGSKMDADETAELEALRRAADERDAAEAVAEAAAAGEGE